MVNDVTSRCKDSCMKTYNLALIGFGGVNRALAELIVDSPARFDRLGFHLRVVAITDLLLGSLVQPAGIDLRAALALTSGETFAAWAGGTANVDNEAVIRNCTADIIAEATFTNPVNGEPAVSHVSWALESGKHVCTTNKGPVAFAAGQLAQRSAEYGVISGYEGSVMSGTPVINFAREQLAGLEIRGFEGILNGTSNYVLGRMESGLSLDEAIREAQQLGYAEADPTADIGGSDVQLKVTILANEFLGACLHPDDVDTTGITVTPDDISAAARAGQRWKLIGSAHRRPDGVVEAQVKPRRLSADHPLAGISGASNAVSFDTDLLGAVTISGPGAGRMPTAYALLSDIIAIDKQVRAGENR
jgi:homoserine dehydrogenase